MLGVNALDNKVQLAVGLGLDAIVEAAWIWARATAARDRRSEPPSGEEKIPGIQRRLSLEGSSLLLARRDSKSVGFALFAPHSDSLEIYYLAVDPDSWSSGVASALLAGTQDHARSIGRAKLELWVIDDNKRALGAYARSGFVDTGQLKRDETTGQVERRLVKHI